MFKNVILLIIVFSASCTFAGYTYTIKDGDNFGDKSLNDAESLLMTGGQGHYLTLNDYSTARIEGTDPLISEGIGGIWSLRQIGFSSTEILSGEIHEFDIGSDSRVIIFGGRIDQLWSYQHVNSDPHIAIICRDWIHNIDTNLLTGTWEDFSTFDIQLIDVDGFSPAIDNIAFTIVPEPMSLILMGIGAVAIRKRRV